MNTNKHRLRKSKKSVSIRVYLWMIFFVAFLSACSQLEKPKTEPFYAETAPPQVKEFRWSNGKLPKSFDPARAASPPETDFARALYEGLTDTNAKTLETVPAIAASWSASDDYRTWTFKLRRDARWSNGERLTARDFVGSWHRLADLGGKAPHTQLLGNIAGVMPPKEIKTSKKPEELNFIEKKIFNQDFPSIFKPTPNNDATERQSGGDAKPQTETKTPETAKAQSGAAKPEEKAAGKTKMSVEQKFGVEAVDDFTLKISLIKPDKDFPALAAHPVFRPVYGDGKYFESGALDRDIVTSGAFRVSSVSPGGVTLKKSETFWNKNQIELEAVRFVAMDNAERALEAYRAGELDAVTNVEFEPLALKLLTPFDDFRRTPHGALNFYEFNRSKAPFDDRRVREALSISIERERLTEDEMDGASVPALDFSPFEMRKNTGLKQDAERARTLLAKAGYANGENFPAIRLLVNRNNVQQRIARAAAKMWKRNLNVETEIIVKDQAEFDAAQQNGDYDLLRRGVVLPTIDEAVNMLAIFAPENEAVTAAVEENDRSKETEIAETGKNANAANARIENDLPAANSNVEMPVSQNEPSENAAIPASVNNNEDDADAPAGDILNRDEAAFQIRAIPLYFPTAYSLVKPYIQGFEINALDAPSLQNVRIDNSWQPKKAKKES